MQEASITMILEKIFYLEPKWLEPKWLRTPEDIHIHPPKIYTYTPER